MNGNSFKYILVQLDRNTKSVTNDGSLLENSNHRDSNELVGYIILNDIKFILIRFEHDKI